MIIFSMNKSLNQYLESKFKPQKYVCKENENMDSKNRIKTLNTYDVRILKQNLGGQKLRT